MKLFNHNGNMLNTSRYIVEDAIRGINHRGYSTCPENTLSAYKESARQGFKYVECDISFTSDGVPVLLHDSTINRTARNVDGTELEADVNIGSITYEDALAYDFGIWKSADFAGEKIPTFEEFIALCRNLGLHAYIELKTDGAYTEEMIFGLVQTVREYGMENKVSWISYSTDFLGYVCNASPVCRIGLVHSGDLTQTDIDSILALKTDSNEIFVDILHWNATASVELCKANYIPLEIWTPNSSHLETVDPYVSGATMDTVNFSVWMRNKILGDS